jgi:hypothetical protein
MQNMLHMARQCRHSIYTIWVCDSVLQLKYEIYY